MTRDLQDNKWFQTIKGNPFYLFDPWPEDFDIEEIAHSLAMQCRFNGHCKQFYTVAQHSVLVSRLLEEWHNNPATVMCGLLHDAAEAYVGDLIRPLKLQLPEYKKVEDFVELAIAQRFELPFPFPASVKTADIVMLHVEKRELLAHPPRPWAGDDISLPEWGIGRELSWREAKRLFLDRFEELAE